MGVRRIRVNAAFVAKVLREGCVLSGPLAPVQMAEVLDARCVEQGRYIELLVESLNFDGPSSGDRLVDIAGGRWDEFPEIMPQFRVYSESALRGSSSYREYILPAGTYTEAQLREILETPGRYGSVDDPDDRHGDVAGS